MSSSPLLLESRMEPDRRDSEIVDLRRQLSRLDEALRLERNKNGAIEAGVRELRHVLNPLYRALQKVFGEMDVMGVEEALSVMGAGKWDAIKSRNPGRIAEAIDILLLQAPLSTAQLAAAMRMNRTNCGNNVVTKMKSMGLIEKVGNGYQLRSL